MKILVLGCKGQLGRCLNDQLSNIGQEAIYTSRENIDISDFEDTKNKILEIAPDVVINATAYTFVDKAEEDQLTANLINHLAVANIAKICDQLSCWFIHISTDYVFDGNSKTSYKEDDKTSPQCVYGKSKLKGELAIKSSGCKHIIIRTAWVYSEYGNNFLKTILHLGSESNEVRVVNDQIGSPTYAQDVAKAIIVILRKLNSEENILGTYHFVGEVTCSWADFAEEILKEAVRQDIIKNKPKVYRINTSEFKTLAKRPMHSQLDCSKFKYTFGIIPLNYTDSIHSVLVSLK
jgi:dTDP-4-dehydrorhamnose reductase